jgi:hypothetical protein
MFKILELKSSGSPPAAQVGNRYPTREQAVAAIKKHVKTFNASGHNPEENYWWARDAEGLRKCWISSTD